jgi:transposase
MIPAGQVERLQQEIARAKQRFGLPEEARVVSCYEASRDGFWLHRDLVTQVAPYRVPRDQGNN